MKPAFLLFLVLLFSCKEQSSPDTLFLTQELDNDIEEYQHLSDKHSAAFEVLTQERPDSYGPIFEVIKKLDKIPLDSENLAKYISNDTIKLSLFRQHDEYLNHKMFESLFNDIVYKGDREMAKKITKKMILKHLYEVKDVTLMYKNRRCDMISTVWNIKAIRNQNQIEIWLSLEHNNFDDLELDITSLKDDKGNKLDVISNGPHNAFWKTAVPNTDASSIEFNAMLRSGEQKTYDMNLVSFDMKIPITDN